jgi:multidrug efflux pump subunit AcrA (membrane-fusion protein)
MKAFAISEVFMFHRRAFSFLIVVGFLPFAVAACHDATASSDPRTQPPLVRVATVETSVHAERSFSGIVAARVQSDLGFRVPGKVLERLVDARR